MGQVDGINNNDLDSNSFGFAIYVCATLRLTLPLPFKEGADKLAITAPNSNARTHTHARTRTHTHAHARTRTHAHRAYVYSIMSFGRAGMGARTQTPGGTPSRPGTANPDSSRFVCVLLAVGQIYVRVRMRACVRACVRVRVRVRVGYSVTVACGYVCAYVPVWVSTPYIRLTHVCVRVRVYVCVYCVTAASCAICHLQHTHAGERTATDCGYREASDVLVFAAVDVFIFARPFRAHAGQRELCGRHALCRWELRHSRRPVGAALQHGGVAEAVHVPKQAAAGTQLPKETAGRWQTGSIGKGEGVGCCPVQRVRRCAARLRQHPRACARAG